jgi:hypothetical protein
MGILARILGFFWRRWADYQSVVAILDVLDFKTAVGGGFGFVAMTFIGATNMSWSAPGVILAALGCWSIGFDHNGCGSLVVAIETRKNGK